jgi:hypothetical protein
MRGYDWGVVVGRSHEIDRDFIAGYYLGSLPSYAYAVVPCAVRFADSTPFTPSFPATYVAG